LAPNRNARCLSRRTAHHPEIGSKYLDMNNFEKLMLLALASGAMVNPAAAQSLTVEDVTRDDDSIRFSTGVHFSTGHYGEAVRTTVVSAPLSLKYTRNNLSVRISVPYIWIDGPATLLDASHGGDAVTGGVSSLNETGDPEGRVNEFSSLSGRRQGLGDVTVAATYSFDLGSNFYFDASGRVRLPTASTRNGIGTGNADILVSGDLSKEFGPTTIYVHARRRFLDSTGAPWLRNSWGAGAGVSLEVGEGPIFGVDYDWQRSPIQGEAASNEVTGWASVRLARALNLSFYGSTGLNSESAEFAGGMTLSVRVDK
jgi:hypothetical protein